mgnify:CR=1 FL=1
MSFSLGFIGSRHKPRKRVFPIVPLSHLHGVIAKGRGHKEKPFPFPPAKLH